MRSVVIKSYGDNGVVEQGEVARPIPGSGEILVKVVAAGVNPIDWKIRNGAGQRMGMTLPIYLGGEISGIVEAVGSEGSEFEVGQEVYGIIKSGGFSEYAIAKETDVVRKPRNLDHIEAAASPLGALTAWQAMIDIAKLSAGQKVLITNSSGGVGSMAVQLAKAKSAHVIAMASSRNADYVLGLGADEFIDYTSQSFEEVVSDVDVVFDTVGGDTFDRAFKVLNPGGFLVTAVAFPSDEDKRRGVGVARVQCVPNPAELIEITDLIEAGRLKPSVATILPVEQVREALALSEAGRTRGKIVLRLSPDTRD